MCYCTRMPNIEVGQRDFEYILHRRKVRLYMSMGLNALLTVALAVFVILFVIFYLKTKNDKEGECTYQVFQLVGAGAQRMECYCKTT